MAGKPEMTRLLMPRSGRTASGAHRQAAEHSPGTTQGRLKVSAAEGVRAAVLAHIGLTIASEWMFTPELRSGAVRAVLSEWCLPPRSICGRHFRQGARLQRKHAPSWISSNAAPTPDRSCRNLHSCPIRIISSPTASLLRLGPFL
jgi:DNA-binding transcriptional LysR family regulator